MQEQINLQKTHLDQLVISAQLKLKSNSIFSTKNKEKTNLYQNALTDLLASSSSDEQLTRSKEILAKKLTMEEIGTLLHAKAELSRLETELRELPNQQQQSHVYIRW